MRLLTLVLLVLAHLSVLAAGGRAPKPDFDAIRIKNGQPPRGSEDPGLLATIWSGTGGGLIIACVLVQMMGVFYVLAVLLDVCAWRKDGLIPFHAGDGKVAKD